MSHRPSAPPALKPYWFYSSSLPIDDPLSPVPSTPTTTKHPPRPFSRYDSTVLESAYKELLKETRTPPRTFPAPGKSTDPTAHEGHISFTPSGSSLRLHNALSTSAPLPRSPPPPAPSPVPPLVPEMSAANVTPLRNPFIRSLSQARAATQPPPASTPCSRRSSWHKPATPEPVEVEQKEIAVGIQRLHKVLLPSFVMTPIYWSPLHDASTVVRGSWFYKDTMLPVETEIANRLETGWEEVMAWTEEWEMELASAVEVGREGEEKVRWRLWPQESTSPVGSRPGSAEEMGAPKRQPEPPVEAAEANAKVKPNEWDWVLFANERDAYIARDSMLSFGNKRPLAAVRKGKTVGTHVVRGFEEREWLKLHPPKKGTAATQAAGKRRGAAAGQTRAKNIPPEKKKPGQNAPTRAGESNAFAAGGNVGGFADQADEGLGLGEDHEDRGKVTDLILVIHGIGQKISERIESFHFTHAVNSFRRHVNVELRSDSVLPHLRPDAGLMILPVNWRHNLTFDDNPLSAPAETDMFTLEDITPHSIPAIRGLVGDIFLDIPYYLSHHKAKMVSAVIAEANRVYRLWLHNNPGFAQGGRVHIIAHSLGTAIALDVLSNQPTVVTPDINPDAHFLFNTHNLFLCGSPASFFLLLNRRKLLPRTPPRASTTDPVFGNQGTYGCMAITNLYNILHYSDPIAYTLTPCVDPSYAHTLRTAYLPSTSSSLLSSLRHILPYAAGGTDPYPRPGAPPLRQRMPSNVELETHDFGREEIAERRVRALNENGQLDWYLNVLRPLENQYLNMLGAHSSYWESRDFARAIAVECGRVPGVRGCVEGMGARKRRGWK